MEFRVHVKGLTEKDWVEARKLYAEEYPGEEDKGEAALFKGEGELEYLGDGELSINCDLIDGGEEKYLSVWGYIHVEELLKSDEFWAAVEHLVEEEKKRQKRLEMLKKMLEARESVKP